ncbi:MAG: GNAT family N-acetyltransferase [Geminicoccaceae bacterium]
MNEQAAGAVRIEPARPDDLERLGQLALRSKAHWGYDRDFIEACREELSVPPSALVQDILLVARQQERIRGFVRMDRLSPAELEALFVDPGHMGQGLGRKLFDAAMAHCRASRIVVASDPHAVGFYESIGFRADGMTPSGAIAGRMLPRLVYDRDSDTAVLRGGESRKCTLKNTI